MVAPHLLVLAALAVGPPAKPVARAELATGSIKVDGRLKEADWSRAPAHRLEWQQQPDPKGKPSLPTTFRVLAGRDALYIGVRCEHDDAVPIVPRRTRRDRGVEADRVSISIDTRGRRSDAFHFGVTSGGSLNDGIRYNENQFDKQWDEVWFAAVSLDNGGWTAEFEIPYRVLRRPPGTTAPVTMQVRRYISALGETDQWAFTPRDNSQEVSRYGELRGFELPARRVSADVTPFFSVGALAETRSSAPIEPIRRLGGDVKIRAGSDLTIDAAVFPDFGNVEADTAVLNLKTSEVRFPEKRPFFLEGVDVFKMPLEVFYSRRIGSLTGQTAGNVIDAPPPAPVLGASKLLARLGRRWSLGMLGASTLYTDVDVRDSTLGVSSTQRVAPTYSYAVARARRELRHGGYFGFMGTTRFSFDPGPRDPWPQCPDGQDAVDGDCFADVYVLSTDGHIRSRDGSWRGTAQLVGTFRHGGTPHTELDGNVLEAGDIGPAMFTKVEKTAGLVIGHLEYKYFGRDADYNATGFLPLPNRHDLRGHLAIRDLQPHGPVLDDRWQVEVFQRFSLEGVPLGSGYQANHRAKWRSFWTHFTEFHIRPAYFDNRETRDGTLFERAWLWGWEQKLKTDHRRPVVGELEFGAFQQRTNGFRSQGKVFLNWRPRKAPALQLRLGLDGTIDRGEPRWLASDPVAGVYRFGRLDARALGLLTRLNYTFTPRLELQVFGQVLGAGTRYDEFFTGPFDAGRIRLRDLEEDPGRDPIRSTDAVFTANVFLRWEYALGANLYLVFTRNQIEVTDPDGDGRIDFAAIGRTSAGYTVLAKTTVRFGL